MKIYIETLNDNFIVDSDKVVAFEKIMSKIKNPITKNEDDFYYNMYTIDGKYYQVTKSVYNNYMRENRVIRLR